MTRFAIILVLVAIAFGSAVAAENAQQPSVEFKVQPIGHVKKADDRMLIVMDKKYQDGLLGLRNTGQDFEDKNTGGHSRTHMQILTAPLSHEQVNISRTGGDVATKMGVPRPLAAPPRGTRPPRQTPLCYSGSPATATGILSLTVAAIPPMHGLFVRAPGEAERTPGRPLAALPPLPAAPEPSLVVVPASRGCAGVRHDGR